MSGAVVVVGKQDRISLEKYPQKQKLFLIYRRAFLNKQNLDKRCFWRPTTRFPTGTRFLTQRETQNNLQGFTVFAKQHVARLKRIYFV